MAFQHVNSRLKSRLKRATERKTAARFWTLAFFYSDTPEKPISYRYLVYKVLRPFKPETDSIYIRIYVSLSYQLSLMSGESFPALEKV
jgi:hypothetical protein